jgi:hypothetical protein
VTGQTVRKWPPIIGTVSRISQKCVNGTVPFGYANLSALPFYRTSQETHLWASTVCFRDRFPFIYVDGVRCGTNGGEEERV